MNDYLTKLILEKEQKRFGSIGKEIKFFQTFLDDLNNELSEKKIKGDAMSHYQEDKNHHKRSSNYAEYNQWDYFGQQDIQPTNNHSRRGHFSFGGASQQHSAAWNSMSIGMPRQTNPYYTNPHSHVMPAHAHSEYRYSQWNNPSHKNMPNIHNAHSQNTILPQTKVDIKSHADITNSVQGFGIPLGGASDYSKFRPSSRDVMHRAPSNVAEKSTRTGIQSEHSTSSVTSTIRNSTSIRTPPIPSHPKTIINNPLSDLQMLVTNQDNENLPQKADNFQQESVDLSAHSEILKLKENLDDRSVNGKNKDLNESRSLVSVIQMQNKQVKSDSKESEKPVELTSKSVREDIKNENVSVEKMKTGENLKEIIVNEVNKSCEELGKTSVIVSKNSESLVGHNKNEKDIPKNECQNEEKENLEIENKKENEEKEKKPNDDLSKADNMHVTANETKETSTCQEAKDKGLIAASREGTGKNCKRKAEDELELGENKKVNLEDKSQSESEGLQEITRVEYPDLATVTSTSTETKPSVNEIKKKTPKKKPSQKSRLGRLSSGQSSGSERSLSCKKSKNFGNKEDKKKIKKALCDAIERRGPFLHVEGFRESPTSVIVVNFPKGDDEDEKEKNFVKKLSFNAGRTRHHNELDYRGRSRNGLYSSTLSARYDAHTTDHTWVCVFCKKGPHYNTMGDLFGPYIISKDENFSLGDFSGDEKDISDAQKRGGRNKKSIRSNNMVEHFQKMSRKLRRTQSTESCLTGMTVISDDQIDQLRYEVWVHEQCAVWSPNVFLIGSRIIGMQEAIWCSIKTMCSKCGIYGANLGCVYRNCPNRSHYPCAKESGWSLEQETFISTCQIHKPRS